MMLVSYDTEVGSTYVELADTEVRRTVSISDLVMVDLDDSDQPVGVEFAVGPAQITVEMLEALGDRFSDLKGLTHVEDWLLSTSR